MAIYLVVLVIGTYLLATQLHTRKPTANAAPAKVVHE